MKKKIFTSLGLMSGTSMDGVDLSIIKSDGYEEISSILNVYKDFDDNLYEQLTNIRDKITNISDLKTYSNDLKELEKKFTLFNAKMIADVIKNINEDIDLVGFHGQTIFHNSRLKISKQLGDGNLLSHLLQKIIINNFRQNDLDNEGQGAPLTPVFHHLISKNIQKKFKIEFPISIINIGGITNVTQIKDFSNNLGDDLFAFDIAPGNCMIDEWVRNNIKLKYDKNGNYAKTGKVDSLVLNQAIDNFEIKSYEKSLDIKDFDISFLRGLSLEDGCATLTKFSAHLIATGIEDINNQRKKSSPINLVCGGGRKNNFLIQQINENLKHKYLELENIDNYGFDGDFIESQAFGYLSIRTYLNLPISFPNTTRCKSETVGGIINKNF